MPLVSVVLASRSRQAEPIHTNECLPELRGGEGEMISLWVSGAVSSFKSHGYLLTKTATTIVSWNNNMALKTLFYSINSPKCLLALCFLPEMLNLKDIPKGKKWRSGPPKVFLAQSVCTHHPSATLPAPLPVGQRWRQQSGRNHISPLLKSTVKNFQKVNNKPRATSVGRDGFAEAVMVLFCFLNQCS